MPGAVGELHVQGLRGLIRAFGAVSKNMQQDLIFELQEAADPVRRRATQIILAPQPMGLRGMRRTPFYAQMRIGVSRREGVVYVAPAWHRGRLGRAYRRPNLAKEFQPRMEQALAENQALIFVEFEKFLERIADYWAKAA